MSTNIKTKGALKICVDPANPCLNEIRFTGLISPSSGKNRSIYKGTFREAKVAVKCYDDKDVAMESVLESLYMLKTLRGSINPGINILIAAFVEEGSIFILSDLCLLDFKQLVSLHRLTKQDAVVFTLQLISAIDYVHGKKWIHTNVSPSNCLLHIDGTLKLSDFKFAIEFSSSLFPNRKEMFSNADREKGYNSHVLDGNKDSDKSDVFSIGAMLYFMLKRKRLFEISTQLNDRDKLYAKGTRIKTVNLEERIKKQVPVLDEVLLRMVSEKHSLRPSCAELLNEDKLWTMAKIKDKDMLFKVASRGVLLALSPTNSSTFVPPVFEPNSRTMSRQPLFLEKAKDFKYIMPEQEFAQLLKTNMQSDSEPETDATDEDLVGFKKHSNSDEENETAIVKFKEGFDFEEEHGNSCEENETVLDESKQEFDSEDEDIISRSGSVYNIEEPLNRSKTSDQDSSTHTQDEIEVETHVGDFDEDVQNSDTMEDNEQELKDYESDQSDVEGDSGHNFDSEVTILSIEDYKAKFDIQSVRFFSKKYEQDFLDATKDMVTQDQLKAFCSSLTETVKSLRLQYQKGKINSMIV